MLKIAYISFEYPPHTAIGGISTYTQETAKLLAAKGNWVEIFTSTPGAEILNLVIAPTLLVHYISCKERNHFHQNIVLHFSERHTVIKFDVAESPEYQKEGLSIKKMFPNLPMVVRFHTPSFWSKELNKAFSVHGTKENYKKLFGIKQYKKEKDKEYNFAQLTNRWVTPSQAMKDVLIAKWDANPENITVLPNPFFANEKLLSINAATNSNIITYIGRLEIRKGLTQLTKAIPLVLQKYPSVKFRFIGKSDHGPNKRIAMADYMKSELKSYSAKLEFINHVPKEEIENYLAQTDICVFPSLWEVFGYVCVEAMAAARGIVASKHGGMKDMLENINGGILIDPFEPQQIADGILYLLNNPGERIAMGLRSRKKAVDYYSKQVINDTEIYYKSIL